MCATYSGHGEVVEVLLQMGADIHSPNKVCDYFLTAACVIGVI